MTGPQDDDLWRPGDYDDEPRSHGNFGLDRQQQEAADRAERERKSADQERDRTVPTEDERQGMAWWNELDESSRRFWLEKVGTGRASDAWESFKREIKK